MVCKELQLGKATARLQTTDRTHIAASFAVNENIYLCHTVCLLLNLKAAGNVDQEDSGFAASYTMGSMSLSELLSNKSDNAGGTSGNDDTHKEISLAFAF